MTRLLPATLACIAFATAATLAQSQPSPGPGASAPHRMGLGGMGPRFGAGVTPGWSMMTPEERDAHRQAMSGAKTQADCVAARDKHHADMQARAKERGITMPVGPRRDVCAGLPKP